jgi:uncharacterized RDD family membrane protein YckC
MTNFNDSLAPISLRVIAGLIDFVIVSLSSVLIFYFKQEIFPFSHAIETQNLLKQGQLIIIGICVDMSYTVFWQQSNLCGTYGQHLLGIKVVDKEGTKISFNRACGRYFASLISSVILKLGFIVAFFTDKKQTLHDLIAETIVLKMTDSEKNDSANDSKLNLFFYSFILPILATFILIAIEPLPKPGNSIAEPNRNTTPSDGSYAIRTLAVGKISDIKCTNLNNGKAYFFSITPSVVADKTHNLTYRVGTGFGKNIGFSSDEMTNSEGFTYTLFGQLDPERGKLYINLLYKSISKKTDSFEFDCTENF